MTNQQLKEIGRKVTDELWNKGNLEALDEFFDDKITLNTPMGSFQGKDAMRNFVGMHREAFPDLKVEQHQYYSDGDSTALEWTFTGTHNGPFLGIEPTGNSVRVNGMTATKYEDDKVIEQTFYWDRVDQLEAVGLEPKDIDKIELHK